MNSPNWLNRCLKAFLTSQKETKILNNKETCCYPNLSQDKSSCNELTMSEINKHVYQALETYCNLTVEPEYAVLLKGSWGCGKTHFVEDFIEQQKTKSGFKFLFVSLYGISGVEAIEDKFFQQLNPVLSSKKMVLAGKIGKGLLKGTLKLDLDGDDKTDASLRVGVPDINIADYLTDTQNCILVFDDLERCSMPLDQILGYINYFVEKDGYKVIVIADEDKLIEKESLDNQQSANTSSGSSSYTSIKEKLIGKTLHLESDSDRVFDILYHNTIKNAELRSHFIFVKQSLIDIYIQSGYENLRSLRKIFIEFNSLYALFDKDIKSHSQLISHLLKIYTILSMEIYSGKLRPKNLRKIIGGGTYVAELADEDVENAITELRQITDKYTINLNETLINSSDWQSWFDKGIIDTVRVNDTLRQSLYIQGKNAAEWKKLLCIFDLEQAELDQLKVSVWQSFSNHEISEFGEIKHVVGIYLFLSKHGLISKDSNDVLSDAIGIVKDGSKLEKLNIPDSLDPEDDFSSHSGFAYTSEDTAEFQQFNEFLCLEVHRYQEKNRISNIPGLLSLMKSDVEQFKNVLCNHKTNSFTFKPILHGIDVDEFISDIESLKNNHKRAVFLALRIRYKNQKQPSMEPEFDWIRDVLKKIELQHKNINTIDSLVMMQFVDSLKGYVNS